MVRMMTWYACPRLLTETFEPELTTAATQFDQQSETTAVVEVGPRMSFSTAWSANAVSICHSCGLGKVTRMEKSHRYQLKAGKPISQQQQLAFAAMVRPAPGKYVALSSSSVGRHITSCASSDASSVSTALLLRHAHLCKSMQGSWQSSGYRLSECQPLVSHANAQQIGIRHQQIICDALSVMICLQLRQHTRGRL